MPTFALPDTISGDVFSTGSLADELVVVAFICNHCPFVVHLKTALAEFGRRCKTQGVRMLAISSNDAQAYPADGPEQMAIDAATFAYPFPYLYDQSQEVAKAFDAACTPDFFVFDRQAKLAYRGQFDDSRPGNGKPITGADLQAAVDALVSGSLPSSDQKPSIGCNIKWR